MSNLKEEIGKATILSTGIGMISAGAALIQAGQIESGVALAAVGFGLVAVYVYLMEREVVSKVMKKLEGKGYSDSGNKRRGKKKA